MRPELRTPTVLAGCLLAARLCLPAPLAAQPADTLPPGRRVTLPEALARFERHNLDLRLARDEAAAARARVRTAGARPNPSFSGTRDQLSGGDRQYDETILALHQTLELGGQRAARRHVAERLAAAAEARIEAEQLRLGFEVRRAYARAAAAEASLVTLTETAEVFRQVERSGEARFAEGDISDFERQRLRVERARYETLFARTTRELSAAARELTALVTPDSLGVPGFLLYPAETPGHTALPPLTVPLDAALLAAADRADVRAAALEAESARAALALQRRERLPDPTLSAGYKDQSDGLRGVEIALALPLPLLDRNQGPIAEAEAAVARAETRRRLVLARAETDVRRAWEGYGAVQARLRPVATELLGQAGGLLRTARAAYAEGEMTLLELLDAADAYRAARETATELFAEALVARYDLERALGRPLPAAPQATPTRTPTEAP